MIQEITLQGSDSCMIKIMSKDQFKISEIDLKKKIWKGSNITQLHLLYANHHWILLLNKTDI